MSSYKTFEGDFQPRNARFAVVVGRFNEFITERLLAAALDTLKRHGVEDSQIEIVRVPGAYEMPLAAKKMATAGKYDAIIALACVIRGATPHFDYVAGACERGLSRVSLDYDTPVGFGVLTVDTVDQAIERAGSKAGNKGADAAMAALEMVSLLRQLE